MLLHFNNFNKTDSEKHEQVSVWQKHEILDWKYINQFFDLQIVFITEIFNSYALHEKLNKNRQEPDYHIFKLKTTFFYLLLFVFVPLVVIRYHSLYQSLSLDVPLVCIFLNDHLKSETSWTLNL